MTWLIFLTERTCDIGLATRTCDTDLRHLRHLRHGDFRPEDMRAVDILSTRMAKT
jgi:hypothetical protein